MAQIRQVVSESLQATIRRLLPSQQGFTEDLQATNVITPIIDLTPTAEGSALDTDFARALAFGSQTAFEITNTTSVIVNNAGFYRIVGGVSVKTNSTLAREATFQLSDGLSTKDVWGIKIENSGDTDSIIDTFDLIVFLAAGHTLSGLASSNCFLKGSSRQVADVNGNIVNPSGFTVS